MSNDVKRYRMVGRDLWEHRTADGIYDYLPTEFYEREPLEVVRASDYDALSQQLDRLRRPPCPICRTWSWVVEPSGHICGYCRLKALVNEKGYVRQEVFDEAMRIQREYSIENARLRQQLEQAQDRINAISSNNQTTLAYARQMLMLDPDCDADTFFNCIKNLLDGFCDAKLRAVHAEARVRELVDEVARLKLGYGGFP